MGDGSRDLTQELRRQAVKERGAVSSCAVWRPDAGATVSTIGLLALL